MNLKKIMRLCSAEKTCCILRNPVTGKQWLGTGTAIYPVEGIELHAEMIPFLFGIEPDALKDWRIEERDGVVPEIEITEQDVRVQCWNRISVRWNNADYVPLVHKGEDDDDILGCWWVRADEIAPARVKDKPLDYRMRSGIALYGVGMLVNGASTTLEDGAATELRTTFERMLRAEW